jgi:hypothetical protein
MAASGCERIHMSERLRLFAHLCRRKMWPDVGASLPASVANKLRFNVGQPNMVRPLIGRQGDRVAAPVVAAKDDDTEDARLAHFAEGNLDRQKRKHDDACCEWAGSVIPARRDGKVARFSNDCTWTQIRILAIALG